MGPESSNKPGNRATRTRYCSGLVLSNLLFLSDFLEELLTKNLSRDSADEGEIGARFYDFKLNSVEAVQLLAQVSLFPETGKKSIKY